MHPLIVIGIGAQQFSGRAGDPAPDDARELIVADAQPLRLAFGDVQRVAHFAAQGLAREAMRRSPCRNTGTHMEAQVLPAVTANICDSAICSASASTNAE